MIILHDILADIVHAYIALMKKKNVLEEDITIPKNIAIPLTASSKAVKIKEGMTTSITYLWKPLNKNYITDPENLTFDDFELRWYFTSHHKD
jgi:hypothetical protein